jgi:hypothetical protein
MPPLNVRMESLACAVRDVAAEATSTAASGIVKNLEFMNCLFRFVEF